MIEEAGIKVLFDTLVVKVLNEGDVIKGVIIEGKGGRGYIEGKVIIDASGDGDVAFYGGADMEWRDRRT